MSNLFPRKKDIYIHSIKKNESGCIICNIIEKCPEVENLLVYCGKHSSASVNLYPYNSGHLMIFPNRHLTDIRDLSSNEEVEINKLTKLSLNILDNLYHPCGYNVGYNIGDNSGASIKHLHLHIIPRFFNELGVIDIIGGAKIIIEDPNITKNKIAEEFKIIANKI